MLQKFIEHRPARVSRWLRLGVSACLLALAGCQWMPASTPSGEPSAAGADEVAAVVRAPDPYLIDPPAVPAAAKKRFQAARVALQQQQWELAETDLLWITENYPQFSGPWLNLAILYQHTGETEKIEAAFQQAIAANRNNTSAYNEYGIFLRGAGRFEEAKAIYLKALAVWPDSPATHLNLGILYDLYLGDLQQALRHYRAYRELLDEPDRRIEGWIVDTERRLAQQEG